ncbi:hypothetical protein [uncultured Thiocystis sp.]|jgi:hypothetical protein|uniref:hypothetical protein n=1 Tax=uncultured Thiocystis sp. TaxID=1202134 RepID=UPI0025F7ACF1|nr:hypothetical protein [uncultured Thiocystis sp.]
MHARELKKQIELLVLGREIYYDEIQIWLDTDRPLFEGAVQRQIEETNGKIDAIIKPMSQYNSVMRQQITLYQPTLAHLKLVQKVLDDFACNYFISRVEIACDWIVASEEQAWELQRLVADGYRHSSRHGYAFSNVKGTYYFSDRKTHKIVPVLYCRMQPKTTQNDQRPRTHFEYRLIGKKVCQNKNLCVLQHLIDYDLCAFLTKHMTFHPKPTKTQVGKVLLEKDNKPDRHRDTYIQKCDTFLTSQLGPNYPYKDVPLQQLLNFIPELTTVLNQGERVPL